MTVDYDGINSFIKEEIERRDSNMFSIIRELMDDGELTRCDLSSCDEEDYPEDVRNYISEYRYWIYESAREMRSEMMFGA